MKFKDVDIVLHTDSIHKFYVVVQWFDSGECLVSDVDVPYPLQYVFMDEDLLTRSDRRDYILNDILKNK